MADAKRNPTRRGTAKNITLDTQAAAYLVEMARGKTQGRFLSLLLWAEHARQEERKRLKAGITEAFAAMEPLNDETPQGCP